MTDSSKDPLGDPFDLLRAHVRVVALLEQPAVDADELVADITGSIDRADRSRGAQVLPLHGFPSARSPRRRRWFVAGSVATIVAVGGAGVAAYVALRPSDPVLGINCRESAEPGSASVQLGLDDDPIAACANLWKTGDLPGLGQGQSGVVPDLVACTGVGGAIEVLPVADDESCETFGLEPERGDQLGGDPVAELNEQAIELNQLGCRPKDEMKAAAAELIGRLGLDGWRVEVDPSAGACSVLAVDTPSSQIVVRADPLRTPPNEEKMP